MIRSPFVVRNLPNDPDAPPENWITCVECQVRPPVATGKAKPKGGMVIIHEYKYNPQAVERGLELWADMLASHIARHIREEARKALAAERPAQEGGEEVPHGAEADKAP